MNYAVEMQSQATGRWTEMPTTRPLNLQEASDEIRCARAMGIQSPLRIVERTA